MCEYLLNKLKMLDRIIINENANEFKARTAVMNILGNLPTTEKQGKALIVAIEKGEIRYAKTLANTFKKQLIASGVSAADLSYM